MTDRRDLPAEKPEQASPETVAEVAAEAVENGDVAGDGVGSGEVRAVQKQQRSPNAALLLGVLLLVALIGGAFFLVQTDVSSRTPQLNGNQSKRYSIDQVEEEQVAAPTVASVGADVAEKKPPVTPKPVLLETASKSVDEPNASAQPAAAGKTVKPVAAGPLYQVLVGPFLYVNDTKSAELKLQKLGYQSRKIDGRGIVTMYRLQEGRYPATDARSKLPEVKRLAGDAFLLPDGKQMAIYVGSFSDRHRAERYQQALQKKGLQLTIVASDVEMSGKLFLVDEASLPQARAMADKLTDAGLRPEVVRK